MKQWWAMCWWMCSGLALAAPACQPPAPDSLRNAWKQVRAVALRDQPGDSTRLYQFPLLILSPMDGERALQVSRTGYQKHYREIFIADEAGLEVPMRQDMKKSSDDDYIPEYKFDVKKCRPVYPVEIRNFKFIYRQDKGWLMESCMPTPTITCSEMVCWKAYVR